MSPTTGSTSAAQTVTAALDQTQISTLDGGTYTGTVTLTPTAGLPLTLPVSLTIARTQVNFVAPQVIPANTAVNVIIRGENFSSIMPTGVNFNSTAASSFTVVSNTEIHATTAAMPAGNYVVHIANAQGVDRTNAQLTVTSAIPYTAGVLAYSPPLGFPNGFIYDAARQALLVSNWSPPLGNASGVIDRYAYSSANSSWDAPTSVAIPGPNVISLSLSGQQIYVAYLPTASTAFTLAQLDPMTLATIGSVQDPTMQLQGSSIAVANDGRAFIEAVSSTTSLVGYYQYAPLSNALTPVGYDPILGGYEGFVASGNGSVLLAEAGGVTFEYSSAMDQLIRTAVQYSYAPIQINIDGTRVVDYDFNVYDGSGNLLGSLPATTQNCLLGPFSSYAYTYDSNGTVRVFDLSQPAVGGFFADQRTAITPVQSPDSIFTRAAMAITPDEGTLFLAGDAQIVVVPLH